MLVGSRYDVGLKEAPASDNAQGQDSTQDNGVGAQEVKDMFDTITTLLRTIRIFCTQEAEVNGEPRTRNTALEQTYAAIRKWKPGNPLSYRESARGH